jgi:ubiquinone/menaquinone biosynthesis C-methylase UbiE
MKNYLVIMVAILLVSSLAHAQQSRKITVEDWEVRINERQPIKKVLGVMGVKPGLIIGEVGAGTGRVTVWLADAVGTNGIIYANDIDTESLDHLKRRCEKEGLQNVKIIIGTIDDPKLPIATLDIAFMTNTYHHLDKPIDLVTKLRLSLKPSGYLVIVERDKDRCPVDQRDEATSKVDFIQQMRAAGFEVIKIDTTMRVDNIYVAIPLK